MRRIKLFCVAFFVVFAVFAVVSNHYRMIERAKGFSTGPPAGFSGAPDEIDCSACHSGPANNGQFQIIAPSSYVPGQTYQIQIVHTNSDPTRLRWGFQMISLAGSNQAGSFANQNGNTQILTENGRLYAEHTLAGSFGGQAGGATWTMNWTAPATNVGPVNFWASGNQANNNGSSDGDQIYVANASIQPATAAPQYNIFDIGVVQAGDTASQGFGASAGGVGVGRSFRPSNAGSQAFTWTHGGGIVGLPNLAGRAFAVSNAANDSGVVVGTGATTSFGSGRLPLVWNNGVVSQLPLPAGETLGDANDVNASGVAVGSVNAGSLQRGVIYSGGSATVITQTTTGGSFFTTAFGINNSGRVVGTGIDPNNAARNVGMVYDIGSPNAIEVGALPGANGALAFGVSNNGHVTGSSMMNQGSGLPFIYSDAVGIRPVPLPAGTSQGTGRAVNSAGHVVGTASSAFAIPFLWDGGNTYRLQDLIPAGTGWDLSMNTSSSALGISDNGVIVGTGVLNGQVRAYAMVPVGNPTPTPTPSPTPTPTPNPTPTPSVSPTPLYSRADYDGDNKTDITVWRPSAFAPPNQNLSAFYTQRTTNGSFFGIQFGNTGDVAIAGDFDGDNKTDFGVSRYNTSAAGVDLVYLESSTNTAKFPVWGNAGDVFVSGDYDGDKKTDVMAWRPSDGTWYIVNSSGANGGFTFIAHGQSLDKVYAMDTDGDGKHNLVYFRPSSGNWVVRNNDGSTTTTNFGVSSDIPVPADYDGDNKDDIAVFRDGMWIVLRSSNGQVQFTPFGSAGDVPVPGDYDGDNLYDRAVFRQGIWHMLRSTAGYTGVQFGAGTDTAMPRAYIP